MFQVCFGWCKTQILTIKQARSVYTNTFLDIPTLVNFIIASKIIGTDKIDFLCTYNTIGHYWY